VPRRPQVGETIRYPIEPGQRGINLTMIPRMVEAVREDHADPVVRGTAVEVIRKAGCLERDEACFAAALYNHVNRRFFWTDDPVLEETFLWPRRFVAEMNGKGKVYADCASVNAAIIALLGAVGSKAAFYFVGDGQRDRGERIFYHVMTVMVVHGKPFFFEPTLHLEPGTAPPRYRDHMVVNPWR